MDWAGMDGELLWMEKSEEDGEVPSSRSSEVITEECVQNIKLSNGSKNIGEWQRYVILPAKIKQKYILGTPFTNQNNEDQFISIDDLIKYDTTDTRRRIQLDQIVVNGESMAEIDVCEQRKFWITPRNETRILLNDIKIEARTELKFEDYLCIDYLIVFGKRATRQQRKIKDKITFLFLPRQTNSDAFLERGCNNSMNITLPRINTNVNFKNDPNLIFTPGQNGLILSNILSYLSVDDVKNVRFVSKLWAEEGAKQLRKRAWVYFDFQHFYGYTFDNDPHIGMKLFRYDYDVKNSSIGFSLSNTVLSLPRFGDDIDPSPMNKCLMDLDWVFTQNQHRFKKIKLNMNVLKMDFDNVVKVLTIVSPFMEELEFEGEWLHSPAFDGNDVQFECRFPSEDYFSKVKKVSVSVDGCGNMWNAFKTLISAMKMNNVTEVDLNSYSDLDMDCLDCFNNSENVDGKQISVNLTVDYIISEFFMASKFDKPLKKFIVLEPLDVDKVPIFQQVLFKHCKTLEVLSFTTPDLPDEWKLKFPIFEKLKVLNIHCYEDNMDKNFHVIFVDGIGNEVELDYNRHFPSLQSLTLGSYLFKKSDDKLDRAAITNIKYWKEYYFYKGFLPFLPPTVEQLDVEHKEEKLFKNLVYLNIPFEENCPQRMEMIARNFPNVHNKWLNPIRKKLTENKKQ